MANEKRNRQLPRSDKMTPYRRLKIIFLSLCEYVGLFSLARRLTKNELRILCYHGLSDGDEIRWSPGLMMSPELFEKRLLHLRHRKYNIITLDAAVNGLQNRSLPDLPTVITFDDGFKSHLKLAHGLLKRFGFPYTIYVTSHYSIKNLPIANLAINYALWKTPIKILDTASLGINKTYNLSRKFEHKQCYDDIYEIYRKLDSDDNKLFFLENLLSFLNVEKNIIDRGTFRILDKSDLNFLAGEGVDLQLHTHRHRWVNDASSSYQELKLNAQYLFEITRKKPAHFCYPSGVWHREMLPVLSDFGLKSATTCIPGLNTFHTDTLYLHRYLDQEDIHPVEFEALMSGFIHIFKKILSINVN